MRARILPAREWWRLDSCQPEEHRLSVLLKQLRDPEHDVDVIVVEDGKRIVACNAVIRTVHLEGAWISPEYRGNAGVGRRLLRATRAAIAGRGGGWVFAAAASDCMRGILERLGAMKLQADSYVFKTQGEVECRQQ